MQRWEVEDIGVHANIRVSGTENDMIGMGFPLRLAEIIVRRHNDAIEEAYMEGKFGGSIGSIGFHPLHGGTI